MRPYAPGKTLRAIVMAGVALCLASPLGAQQEPGDQAIGADKAAGKGETGKTPTKTAGKGKKTKLTDLKWKKAVQGWGKTLVNKDCTRKPLKRKDGKPVAFRQIEAFDPDVDDFDAERCAG